MARYKTEKLLFSQYMAVTDSTRSKIRWAHCHHVADTVHHLFNFLIFLSISFQLNPNLFTPLQTAMIFRNLLPIVGNEICWLVWTYCGESHAFSWEVSGLDMSTGYNFVIFLLSQPLDSDFQDPWETDSHLRPMRTDDRKLRTIELSGEVVKRGLNLNQRYDKVPKTTFP